MIPNDSLHLLYIGWSTKKEAVERKSHRMVKAHHFLEMWQGSQNIRATQKESQAENTYITAVGHISDMEGIVKASWSLMKHDAAALFKLSKRSPLSPALSANDLLGGQTQILTVHQISTINGHPDESYQDSAPDSISATDDWLKWNCNVDNPNDSEDHLAVDDESDWQQGNAIEDPECQEQLDVSAVPNVPGLIGSTRTPKGQASKVMVTVNWIKTRRSKGVKEMQDTMRQWFTRFLK